MCGSSVSTPMFSPKIKRIEHASSQAHHILSIGKSNHIRSTVHLGVGNRDGLSSVATLFFFGGENMTNWLAAATITGLEKYAYQLILAVFLSDRPRSLWEHGGPLSGCGVLGSGSPAASTSGVHHRRPPIPPPGPQPGRICFSKPREEWLTTPVSKQAMNGGGGGRQLTWKALFKQVLQLTTRSSHATAGFYGLFSFELLNVLCVKSLEIVLTWPNHTQMSLFFFSLHVLSSFTQTGLVWVWKCIIAVKINLSGNQWQGSHVKVQSALFWLSFPEKKKQQKD